MVDLDDIMGRLALLILGLLAIAGGYLFGRSSYQVSYHMVEAGPITPIFVQDGTDYFHAQHTNTYYVIHEKDFSPAFSVDAFTHKCADGYTLLAHRDGQSFDITLSSDSPEGKEYQGTGYTVVQIICVDSAGSTVTMYSTSEYTNHPNGYYDDRWGIGRIVMIAGGGVAALALLAILLPLLFGLLFRRK